MNAASTAPAVLYVVRVSHRRRIAPLYRFVYRLFYVLVDVDRIGEAACRTRLFSHNRFNVLALHDRDHGDGSGTPVREWAERLLLERGVDLAGGRIRLLCIPRVLGFAFNPISLWYCEHADGDLRAVIAEVRNTFGEKHCYVLACDGAPMAYGQPWDKEKRFHVSPFLELSGRYRFVMSRPEESLRVVIHETRNGDPILDATLAGERRDLRDGTIVSLLLRMPATAIKVVAAIHWEALKIWLRGARFHRKPVPPEHGAS